MDKTSITAGLDADDRTALSHLYDLAQRCSRTGMPVFSGFYSPRVQQLAHQRLRGDFVMDSFGGYPQAERQVLCFFPYPDDKWVKGFFPVFAIRIITADSACLSHRDYLGAALGLGLTREAIGDIVVEGDSAVCFCTQPARQLLERELIQVRRSPVHCEPVEFLDELHIERKFETSACTVSSMRLDCVVSAVTGKSRGTSAQLIAQGLVSVNFQVQDACAKPVPDGAVLSVRGFGKVQIAQTGGVSKKGRIHLTIKKYV